MPRGPLRSVVNRHHIRHNEQHDTDERPVFSAQRGGRVQLRSNGLSLRDAEGRELGRLVYDRQRPLKCGARAWLELAPGVTAVPIESEEA